MAWFPATFPIVFDEVLAPDILLILRAYLLTSSDITDVVGQRVFLHTIPKEYTGTTCVVLSETPGFGAERSVTITRQSVIVKCFSTDMETARNLMRTAVFPALQGYTANVENDGTESFGNSYFVEVYETSRPIMLQDPDYKGILWYMQSEYEVILRY